MSKRPKQNIKSSHKARAVKTIARSVKSKPESTEHITINAPLIINGDTPFTNEQFIELLKKHAQNVLQAVRNARSKK